VIGNRVRAKVVKNKVAPPFREAEFDIMYGEGISEVGDILDQAVAMGFINKSGAWFTYNGEKIAQGRENAKTYLKANPHVYEEIEKSVRNQIFSAYSVDEADDMPVISDKNEDVPTFGDVIDIAV